MSNVARYLIFGVIAIIVIAVLSVFIRFLIEIALFGALVAIAYYGFAKASHLRNRNRPWR